MSRGVLEAVGTQVPAASEITSPFLHVACEQREQAGGRAARVLHEQGDSMWPSSLPQPAAHAARTHQTPRSVPPTGSASRFSDEENLAHVGHLRPSQHGAWRGEGPLYFSAQWMPEPDLVHTLWIPRPGLTRPRPDQPCDREHGTCSLHLVFLICNMKH